MEPAPFITAVPPRLQAMVAVVLALNKSKNARVVAAASICVEDAVTVAEV